MFWIWEKKDTTLKNEVLEEMDTPVENDSNESTETIIVEAAWDTNWMETPVILEDTDTLDETVEERDTPNESTDESTTEESDPKLSSDDIDLPHEWEEGQIQWVKDGDLIISEYDLNNLLIMHDSEKDSYKKNLLFNALQAFKTGNNELAVAMKAYDVEKVPVKK